jgi:hypothetical protein
MTELYSQIVLETTELRQKSQINTKKRQKYRYQNYTRNGQKSPEYDRTRASRVPVEARLQNYWHNLATVFQQERKMSEDGVTAPRDTSVPMTPDAFQNHPMVAVLTAQIWKTFEQRLEQRDGQNMFSTPPNQQTLSRTATLSTEADWEVDCSIDPDPKNWSKQLTSCFKRSCLDAWCKRGIPDSIPFAQNDRKLQNGAIRDVLIACRLPASFEMTIRAKMSRKMDQKRATFSAKAKGEKRENAIDEDDMEELAKSAPVFKQVKAVKLEEATLSAEREFAGPKRLVQTTINDGLTPPSVGLAVDLRTTTGETVARAKVTEIDPLFKNPKNGIVIGKGNVLVRVLQDTVGARWFTFPIPYPSGSLPELLVDVDDPISWPIRQLSSECTNILSV